MCACGKTGVHVNYDHMSCVGLVFTSLQILVLLPVVLLVLLVVLHSLQHYVPWQSFGLRLADVFNVSTTSVYIDIINYDVYRSRIAPASSGGGGRRRGGGGALNESQRSALLHRG